MIGEFCIYYQDRFDGRHLGLGVIGEEQTAKRAFTAH